MYCECISCLYNKEMACTRKVNHIGPRGLCIDHAEIPIPENIWDWLKETHRESCACRGGFYIRPSTRRGELCSPVKR